MYYFATAVVAVFTALRVGRLLGVALRETGYPLWDPAAHGLAGLDLADALRDGDALGFIGQINAAVVWPFTNALLLAPGFLFLGDSYATGDVLSALWFGASALLLFAAGVALHPSRGVWIGTAAAALLLASPQYRLFGTLTMLEMPGVFLMLLALVLYARSGPPAVAAATVGALEERGPRATAGTMFRATALATTALFFCKYNYGLLWLAPLLLHEATASSAAGLGRAWARVWKWIRSRRWLRPFWILVGAYAAFLAASVISGGWDVTLLGRRVSMHSPGNPAYLLYLALLARGIFECWRRPARARAAWSALHPRFRTLLRFVGLPLAIWFAVPYPNRVRGFLSFVQNRSEAAPLFSLERIAFYPRAFVEAYAPDPLVGAVVLALALLPPWRSRPGDVARFVYLAAWLGAIVSAAHGYHSPRFLFLPAALLWLCAARSAVDIGAALLERFRLPSAVRSPAAALALATIVAWGSLGGPADARLGAMRRAWATGPALEPVLEWIARGSAKSPTRPVMLGFSNWLSPALVAWHVRRIDPERREFAPHRVPSLPPGATGRDVRARAMAIRDGRRPILVVLARRETSVVGRALLEEARSDSLVAECVRGLPGVVVADSIEFREAGFTGLLLTFPDRSLRGGGGGE